MTSEHSIYYYPNLYVREISYYLCGIYLNNCTLKYIVKENWRMLSIISLTDDDSWTINN